VELREELAQRIESMKTKALEESKPKVILVKEATPTVLAEKLKTALGQTGRDAVMNIVGDDDTMQLFVKAPDELMPQIESMVEILDKPMTLIDMRIYKLNYARATLVLDQMQAMVRGLAGGSRQALSKMDVFSATADARTNSIIVMGGTSTFRLVEEVLKTIDVPDAQPVAIETVVYHLARAQAADVARNINNLFGGRTLDGLDPPRAEANLATNTVLVRGTRKQQEEIKGQVIDKLDEFAGTPTIPLITETIQLAYLNADDAAAQISQEFANRQKAYRDAQVQNVNPAELTVSVTPRVSSKQIVVLASQANVDQIKTMVAELDKEGAGMLTARESRTYSLEWLDAGAAANAINTMFRVSGVRMAEIDQVSTAVVSTTQMVVTASADNHEVIANLLKELDVDKGQGKVQQFYTMKNARASDVANTVNQIIGVRGRTRTGQLPVTVVPDDAMNLLVLSGTPAEIEEVQQIIVQLDQEPTNLTGRIVEVYDLKYADPGSTINALNAAFPRTRGQRLEDEVAFGYTWGTSALVATASPQNQTKIKELLEKIDVEGTRRTTHTIELTEANADEVAQRLQQLFRQTTRTRQGDTTMQIMSDSRTNSLLVFSTEAELEQVKTLVATLDVPAKMQTERTLRSYTLEWIDASAAANAINTLFRVSGTRLPEKDQVMPAVVSSTQLAVTASLDNHARIEGLLKELDVDKGQGKVTHFYTMHKARASDVANTVNQVLGAKGGRTRTGQLPVTVTPDDAMNLLIMSGAPAEIEEVEQIIVQLDQEPTNLTGRIVEVYDLKYADPGSTINALNAAFPRTRGQRAEDEVSFGYTWGTSALVATASPQNQAKIKELLGKIDVEGTSRTTHLIPLKEANADEVAQKLQTLFRATQRARQGDTTMQILAETRTNSLLVFATEAELMQVQAMVENLDVKPTGDAERTVQVYPVQFADPSGIVNAINAQYSQYRASPRDQVTAVVEHGTQSVVVSASAKRHAEVASLIKEVDVEGSQVRATRVVKIEHANAEDLARTLSAAFQRVSTRRGEQMRISADPGTNALVVFASDKEMTELSPLIESLDVEPDLEKDRQFRAFKLTYGMVWDVAEMITQSFRGGRTARDQVTAVPDWGSSSIFVTASPENMKRIEELVKQVDTKSDVAQQVRIVQIKHGDADNIAQTLTEVFSEGGGGGRRSWMPQRGGISITHTPGTDTLLIKARDTEFEEIMAVLEQLDTPERGPGEIRTFALKFMDATEMQGILETYLQKPGSSTGGRRGGAAGGLSGDVRISVSSATNSLVVSGGKDQLDRVAAVIAEIDVEILDGGNRPEFMKLKYATPSLIEPILTQMFVDTARGRGGRGATATQMVPVIVADDPSDQLIVRANPTDMSLIRTMVDTLDTEDASLETGIKVVPLQPGVDVTELASMLQELLDADAKVKESMSSSRGKAQADRVVLSADRRTNSILLAGARSRFEEVENLIRTLEKQGPVGGRTAVIIRPKNMSPDEIKGVLQGVMEDNTSGSGTRGGARPRRR